MALSICRGCGQPCDRNASEHGFCSRCRAAFADELVSLYDWMREQTNEVARRRDPAFAQLVLPTYRHTLSETEALRLQMLYPEGLSDRSDEAHESYGALESICLRGKAATITTTAPCREALEELDSALYATQTGGTLDEPTVRAFFYFSQVLCFFYKKGLLDHERDFEQDEHLAKTLLSRIAPDAAPLDATDGTFGPSPAEIYEAVVVAAFGE